MKKFGESMKKFATRFTCSLLAVVMTFGMVSPIALASENASAVKTETGAAVIATPWDDNLWATAPIISVNKISSGAPTTTGAAQVMWDEEYVYVRVCVTDTDIRTASGGAHNNDSVELFLSNTNDRAEAWYNREGNGQYRVDADGARSNGRSSTTGWLHNGRRTVVGYDVFFAIPFDPTSVINDTIGLDIQINDATTAAGARTGTVNWSDPAGNGYNSSADWGNLVLGGIGSLDPVELGNQTISITAPIDGATPQTSLAFSRGFTGTVAWYNVTDGNAHTGTFVPFKVYRADVTLAAWSLYYWPDPTIPSITVTGQTASNVTVNGAGVGNTLTFSVTFPVVKAQVSYVRISYNGDTGTTMGTGELIDRVNNQWTQRRPLTGHPYVAYIFGTGGYSSYQENNVDYRNAFDGNWTNYFDGATQGHAGVEFTTPQIVTQIEYRSRSGQPVGRLHGAILQGSNDGTNYTNLFTLDVPAANTQYIRNELNNGLKADTPYKFYRIMGPASAEFNPTELAFYTYSATTDPFDIITLEKTLNGGELYNGFVLRNSFGNATNAIIPVEWSVADSAKADMLNGNVIVARGETETLKLTAKVGSVTHEFDVTVAGLMGSVNIRSVVRHGYVLPAETLGATLDPWTIVETEYNDMLNNGVIAARMMTVNLTLRASVGAVTKDFPVTVLGKLDGIDIPDPIISSREYLPTESFDLKPIQWSANPASYLVNGMISLPEGLSEGSVVLTATYSGQTATYTRDVVSPPAKKITFTGNEWGWSDTSYEQAIGNGRHRFHVGSENPRSRYFMYDTAEKAKDYFTMYPFGYGDSYDAMLQESPSDWIINLNGEWDFRYDRAPRNRVWPSGRAQGDAGNPAYTSNTGTNLIYWNADNSGGEKSVFPAGKYGFDTTEAYKHTNDGDVVAEMNGWNKIKVPGNFQVNWNPDGTFKYDRIMYANVSFGWDAYGNGGAGAEITMPPTVSNGTGTYQRSFTVPENWEDKSVFINFDGADAIYVWVDGQPVGYSEDKFTHKEFDITDVLVKRSGKFAGDHTVTVQVIRWSNGSHYENQDHLRLAGIFRSTYIMARNREDLWDFQLDTRPVDVDAMNNGDPTAWELNIKTAVRDYAHHLRETGVSKPVSYELFDANGVRVASGDGGGGAYEMHTTDLTATGYDARFGGGVRWDARRDDRTAWNPENKPAAEDGLDPTIAQISIAKPEEITVTLPADKIHTWSSEDPYLYKLVLSVDNGDDTMYTCVRVGLRYVETILEADRGSTVRVNGKRLTFYGSDIHEINADTGHAMYLGVMRKDVEISKQFNQNAFRLSHYPHDPRLYDLCDEYGIYIMDEANHETHANQSYSTNPLTGPIIRDRQLNMLERTKNFPSVVAWSSGNESRNSRDASYYQTVVLERREADITGRGNIASIGANPTGGRPSHCEYGNNWAQLHSSMYPGISGWSGSPSTTKPVVTCEFAHSLGNSLGNLDSWATIYESRNFDIGGFVWEWVDHSIWTPIPKTNNNPADGALVTELDGVPVDYSRRDNIDPRTHYLPIGGNWGDTRNDTNLCADGVIFADRRLGSNIYEMKRQYQRLKTRLNGDPTNSSLGYTVRNMFMYTNANEYDMTWDITENGTIIRSGSGVLDVDPIPYGRTGDKFSEASFTAQYDAITPNPNAEYFFNIQFHLRDGIKPYSDDPNALPWGEKGHIVAATQIKLESSDFVNSEIPLPPLNVAGVTITGNTDTNTTGTITVTGSDFEYIFNKAEGRFTSMSYQGKQFATTGPEPTFARARIDNEYRNNNTESSTMWAWRLVGQNRTKENTSVSYGDNCVIITAPYSTTEDNRLGSGSNTVYTIYADGEVRVNQTIIFHASAGNNINEVGSVMTLTPGLENITYHGRGPLENYIDRKWGSDVGVWNTTVADNYVEYNCVQHTGNHTDVRWVAATDNDGFGVLVKAGDFPANNLFSTRSTAYYYPHNGEANNASNLIEFNALYFALNEMGNAQLKKPYELYNDTGRRNETGLNQPVYLHLNIAGRGVGGDAPWSGGLQAHDFYKIYAGGKTVNYNYSIKPVSGFNRNEAMDFSREIRNPVQNVKELMPVALANGVLSTNSAYTAAVDLADTADHVTATKVYTDLIKAMAANKPVINFVTVLGKSGVPDANNNILITVPAGTDLTAVLPVFQTVAAPGASVVFDKTGPQDFSSGPVTYTLTADGITNVYVVTVTTDIDISITTVELDDKTVTAHIANSGTAPITVYVLAAVYDDDNKLIEVKQSPLTTVPADGFSNVVVTLTGNTTGKKVKAFIWDEQYVPYTPVWLLQN